MIAILIVFYNDKQHIQRLANSIMNQTYKDYKVFILDNNIGLKHAEYFKEFMPNAEVIKSQSNLGFAGGNNLLSKSAIANNCKYLLILNPDMQMKYDALEKLHDFMEKNDNYVAAGPTLLYGKFEKNSKIQLFGVKANFKTQKKEFLYSGEDINNIQLPFHQEVDLLNGGSLFIRSKYVSNNYLFEEDYFLYNDELDLFKRFKDSALKCCVISSAIFWHHHNWDHTNKKGYNLMYYYMMRNKILYLIKFKYKWQIIKEIIASIILFPVISAFCIRTSGMKMIYYYYLGLLHGLKAKKGKANLTFI